MSANEDTTAEHLLLDEAFLKISYLPGKRMIVLRWTGYAPPADYRRGLDFALEHVVKKNITYWLADLRTMAAILQPEEKWTNEVWFPRLIHAAVLEKMAILPSSDFFNQMSVDRIMDHTVGSRHFQVGYFQSEQESLEWLFDQKEEEVGVG